MEAVAIADGGGAAPPFACTYTPNVPELLLQLQCSIAVSTYQAGKMLFISPVNNEKLIQLPRTFRRAMAIGLNGDKLALAVNNEVIILKNFSGLAPGYPKQPNTYDSLFVPRASYYTGMIDIHGLHWSEKGLTAVNTLFSCLSIINENYSFTPVWKPSFITELAAEDRCHLNGMANDDAGNPLFVTAFNTGNDRESWRKGLPGGGVVIHVPTNEIVIDNLQMPHSPRMFKGDLYVLLSASGEMIRIETEAGTYEVVKRFDGFVRGMSVIGEYAFIGMSRLRKNSSSFHHLPIAEKANKSGVVIMHLPTGGIVGKIEYKSSVDEIFDVQVLPGRLRPGVVSTDNEVHRLSLATPEATYWAKQKKE